MHKSETYRPPGAGNPKEHTVPGIRNSSTDSTDDTEGNGFKGFVKDGVEDDTEGNTACTKHITDGVEDDTEGNSINVKH